MAKFIDFALVKKEVPFADAIELLDLRMKFAANQWRGDCPACGTKDGRSLVITADRGFFCHSDDSGGDVIGLAKHVLDLPSMRDAAFALADRAGITTGTSNSKSTSRTVPESGRRQYVAQSRGGADKASPHQSRPAFDSKEYASRLDYEHEMLTEVGADPEKMRECGIGYQPKGIHRGKIVIRVIDEAGDEHFVAVEGITLPPTLKLNVVPFKKRA